MQVKPQPTPTEKVYLEKKTFEKILFIIGALCFITACVLVIAYSGFMTTSPGSPPPEIKVKLIPDEKTLWLVNAILGIAGGALMNPRKFLAAIPAGLFASAAMTVFTLWYVSFRETLLTFEMLLPLAVGSIVGVNVYKIIAKFVYKGKEEF